jgi:hypothetical protein
MKPLFTFLLICSSALTLSAQLNPMTNGDLGKIIYVVADSIKGSEGNWQFMIKDRFLVCITDEAHDRMRIMSPIIEQKKLDYKELLKLMEANFHTALDVKYAISDEILWSVYIHPLKALQKSEVLSAINQVYTAALTFGTTYNSTGLSFPDIKQKKEKEKRKL